MRRVIGYWMWDPDATALRRSDGVCVRFAGMEAGAPAFGVRKWFKLDVTGPAGQLTVPVEQRLAGRDTNFRGLWYRADFRQLNLNSSLWASTERIVADALASWPRGELIDALPTGVGIEGGYLNQSFRRDFYRLYLPTYVGTPRASGTTSQPPGPCRWEWRRPQGGTAPDLKTAAQQGFSHFSAAAQQMAAVCPSLIAGQQLVALLPDEHGSLRLLYLDPTFGSFRFCCAPRYRGEDQRWSIYEFEGGADVAQADAGRSLFGVNAFFSRPSRLGARRLEALTAESRNRAYSAFHDALFVVPEGAVATTRMISPIVALRSPSPWLRAGYLEQACVTATELVEDELKAAFSDDPTATRPLSSLAGSAFDAGSGALSAPDGSTLALERASDWRGVAPGRLRLRCRSAGLDWPVLVTRVDRRPPGDWDYRPQTMSRWAIDYDQCLAVWHQEGHVGIPEEDAWERLRQFLEEAVLGWGDGPAAGPAPQSLATTGGWYNGEWRGAEFRRLLARPFNTDSVTRTDRWEPYSASRRWSRVDDTPVTIADPFESGYLCDAAKAPFVPFEKRAAGAPPARLFASGFTLSVHRDEAVRTDFVDYIEDDTHIRLGGLRSVLRTASIRHVQSDTPPPDEAGYFRMHSHGSTEAPGLLVWRRLRDAGEGGLRHGETTKVHGAYLFDRFYGGAIRIASLGGEIADFDYHLTA